MDLGARVQGVTDADRLLLRGPDGVVADWVAWGGGWPSPKATAPNFAPALWHHRLADLAAYAAGALGIPPNELVGLGDICTRLDVDPGVAHSALDDAKATAECFRRLTAMRGVK